MHKILEKERKLCASVLSYAFLSFGLMFLLPGYPILCGAFFICMGIYQSFQNAKEANDILFSALLPVAKRDMVKGKFAFVCIIELWGSGIMLTAVLIRMTILSDLAVYRGNALMNANLFALGAALTVFGTFNLVFVRGFFKTAYHIGKPFLYFTAVNFLFVGAAEVLHHIPGMEILNAFAFEHLTVQLGLLAAGALFYLGATAGAYRLSCRDFEKIDL